MTQVMRGVRVLELASWTFVPAAGAVLADWGADVVKVEHPTRPDPQRGLIHAGLAPLAQGLGSHGELNFMMEQSNRGKRSVAIDIGVPDGRALLDRLIESADVFLTNFLPDARRKLRIELEDVRAVNPDIVYVRGHGQGHRGPDAHRAGFDGTAYVARGSWADGVTPRDREWPVSGTAGIGDLPGGMTLAGGIAAALFHRERTGEAPVVDVSLLGVAMWTMSPDIVGTKMYGLEEMPRPTREATTNPITIYYRTKDDRFVKLSMFESDRYFADLCEHLDHPEIAADPRFADHRARAEHHAECTIALDEAFRKFTLDELRIRFETLQGAWAPVQKAVDVHDDVQAIENGYLPTVRNAEGDDFTLVAAPVQFDQQSPQELRPCPGHGEHTEEVLLELGLDWDEIIERKVSGAVL